MHDFIKSAVIGHPISHSKSPLIHNYWINKYKLSGKYKAVDISPDNLAKDVQDLIDDGYSGFNVTIPHKIAIMDLCHEIDEIALNIGAVNTVSIKGGKLYGTNTDAYGFVQNIKTNIPDFDFTKARAVIIGAGGAANAVLYALLDENIEDIIITNRTIEKAQNLAKMNSEKVKVASWDQRNNICKNANLIINTTSLGMKSNPELDIDISGARSGALVTDIVYEPLETHLLKQAKALDFQVLNGIGMLLHQARLGFKLWNGVLPEVTKDLERLVLS